MKFLVVFAVLIAATGVLGQNPYEYVDDALIQKVGQIVYEFDQKQAVNRAGSSNNFNSYQPSVARNVNNGPGYQSGKPERVARVANFDNNMNAQPQRQQQATYEPVRSQRQFNNFQQQPIAQPQQQFVPQQRQFNTFQQQPMAQPQRQFNTVQQQPMAQPQQQYVPQQRQFNAVQQPMAQPRFQAPQTQYAAPATTREYKEPQVSQPKSFGYTLSQPEFVPMVAEFHMTDDSQQGAQGTFRGNGMEMNYRRH